MRKNVVFDPGSAERIAAAVKWVEQFYIDESTDPANYDPEPGLDFSTPPIIVGTFNGVWETDTEASVTWLSSYGTVVTPATNYFAPVGQANADTVCVIGLFEKLSAEYVLLSVEQTPQTAIRGQFTGEWPIQTVASVSYVADDGSTSTQQAHNYFASVGAEGETNNCCIIQAGSEWILIAAQCEEIPPLENEVD